MDHEILAPTIKIHNSLFLGFLPSFTYHQDPIEREARETFTRMDSDRDGGIDEEEWSKSQRVRPMFENAGINASLPMDVNAFVSYFRQAKKGVASTSSVGR